jgi:hypothetical protein
MYDKIVYAAVEEILPLGHILMYFSHLVNELNTNVFVLY